MSKELADLQKRLGCKGCFFADSGAIREAKPCCTRPTLVRLNSDGTCAAHKVKP